MIEEESPVDNSGNNKQLESSSEDGPVAVEEKKLSEGEAVVVECIDNYLWELVNEQYDKALLEFLKLNSVAGGRLDGGGFTGSCHVEEEKPANGLSFQERFAALDTFFRQKIMTPMCVVLVVLSVLHLILNGVSLIGESTLPTREAQPPAPFFPSNSALEDLYDGNSADRSALTSRAEIVVVMFYAPWSLSSMEARRPFLNVATALRNYNNTVKFVAVNCHDHRGGCRAAYKLYSYPIIFAYVNGSPLVVYDQPIVDHLLFSWVQHLMMPLYRIQSRNDFIALRNYDYLVVGFLTPFSDGGFRHSLDRLFCVFYVAAVKAAASRASVAFVTIQNARLAAKLGLDKRNELTIFSAYSSQPSQKLSSMMIAKETRSSNILHWIQENVDRISARTVERLNVADDEIGGKSESLFKKVNASDATLLLFTDDFGTVHLSDAFWQLKKFAKRFYDCQPSAAEDGPRASAEDEPSLSVHNLLQVDTIEEYMRLSKTLCEIGDPSSKAAKLMAKCCANIRGKLAGYEESGYSVKDDVNTHADCSSALLNQMDTGTLLFLCKRIVGGRSVNADKKGRRKHFVDNFPSFDVLPWRFRLACDHSILVNRFRSAASTRRRPFLAGKVEDVVDGANVNGLSCKTNRTFGFLVLDRRYGEYFYNRWLNYFRAVNRDGDDSFIGEAVDIVALVSNVDERIFWMRRDVPINQATLGAFLTRYLCGGGGETSASLPQTGECVAERGAKPPADEPDYGSGVPLVERNVREVEEYINRLETIDGTKFVAEILKKRNQFDAFVFFSGGGWHGPSKVVSPMLHTVIHYFRQFDESSRSIRFFAVDVLRSSMPWQYTFDSVPAFGYFPASNPSESVIFPSTLPVSVPNLMAFLLAHAPPSLRWRMAASAVRTSPTCADRNRQRLAHFRRLAADDMRAIRRALRHNFHNRQHFVVLLRRRSVQRRTARHLEAMIDQIERLKTRSKRQSERATGMTSFDRLVDRLVNDSKHIKWLLNDHLKYPI